MHPTNTRVKNTLNMHNLRALPLQAEGVDVMVAGSRGMGAIARSLLGLVGMGSVSDHLAHHSPCPLLVIKGVSGGALGPDDSAPPTGASGTLRPITEGDGSEASSMQ